MKALVVFAFGREDKEPSISNVKLAKIAERIVRNEKEKVLIIAEAEVYLQLLADGFGTACQVPFLPNGGSEWIWEYAKIVLTGRKINKVIPVAQPFLQLTKVKYLIRRDGYHLISRRIPWIGFNPNSEQWWTRNGFYILVYAVLQFLGFGKYLRGKQH